MSMDLLRSMAATWWMSETVRGRLAGVCSGGKEPREREDVVPVRGTVRTAWSSQFGGTSGRSKSESIFGRGREGKTAARSLKR